jgi:uncharacterized protein DUF5343
MARDLPYLSSYKNVGRLFDGIFAAKQPDSFTHEFLQKTLGIKSTGDRSLIPMLRTLGFIDAANRPTAAYGALKNSGLRRTAIADAIRRAYAPLFGANEQAEKLSNEDLRGLVAQITGSDDSMTSKIVGTFNALKAHGDFNAATPAQETTKATEAEQTDKEPDELPQKTRKGFEPQFHYNIQVQLPANGTEETYLNIFSALRKVFPS